LPNNKIFLSSYPAVKIARLGVNKHYQGGGAGAHLKKDSFLLLKQETMSKL
jgi:hypothetical protein